MSKKFFKLNTILNTDDWDKLCAFIMGNFLILVQVSQNRYFSPAFAFG